MKKLSFLVAKITVLSFFMLMIAPAVLPTLTANAQAPQSAIGSTISANANDNSLVTTFCNALKLLTGSAGKAFAAFAIISLGIGFFTGKISWGLMIGVALGIAAMFGAPTIVAALSGKGAFDCSN